MAVSSSNCSARCPVQRVVTFLFLWFSLPSILFGAPTLEELANKLSCVNGLQGVHDRLERNNRLWLTNPDSNFNIGSRFAHLQQIHSAFRQEVWQFAERFGNVPDNAGAIILAVKDLEQGMPLVMDSASNVAIFDEKFALSLAAIDESYRLIGNEILGLREKCIDAAASAVEDSNTHVNETRKGLAELEGFIREASQKRGVLSGAVYRGSRILLMQRYAQISQVQLDEASRRIDAVLAADVLNSNIQAWWNTSYGRNGLGKGLMGHHLQYFEPLSVMQNDLLTGLDLVQQVNGATGLEPAVLRALQQEITPKIASLQSAIDTLQRRGPNGTLDLQVATNSRRRSVIAQYADKCEPAIDEFDLLLKNMVIPISSDSFNFTATETLYANVVAACHRRTP